jgi:hypothetical protein
MARNEAGHAQQAWRALLDLLREADETFLDQRRGVFGELDVAEGYRHLTHLSSYAFDFFVESDPARPAFVPIALPTKKVLGDNTDSIYFYTNIRGDLDFRITGRRGDECYLSFIVHGGPDATRHERHRTISNLNMRDIELAPDGTFEILLSKTPKPGNWMKLEDDARCVITREYYFDRARDARASFRIERIGEVGPPAPLSDAEMAARLRDVASFISATLQMVPMRVERFNEYAEPFRFTVEHPSWGTPDNTYARCFYRLAPDEALVIEGEMVPCVYWGMQLWNIYMQSLDYRYHRCSVNNRQAGLGPGDRFRVVVAHQDPGVPNWLDTAGHEIGAVFVRWLCAETTPARPTATVVRLGDLRA